jgi:hypothetical protein
LDGLGLRFALNSPEGRSLGDLTLASLVDEKASAERRQTPIQIASGQAGGQPFEIINSLVTTLSGPHPVALGVNLQGKYSSARMGDSASIAFESIKNPVTGEDEGIRIKHHTGFLSAGADVVSAKKSRVSIGDLDLSWPNRAGFATQVSYGN